MSDPVLRLLTVDDLDDALRLSTIVGWNQRLDDWRILLQIAPGAAFAAVIDGRIAATAMGIDYGRFWWIAMMLVDPAYRRRGLGRRLLETAMGAAPAHLPIRLDATPLGRPLYLQYDFVDECTLSRHVRRGRPAFAPASSRALRRGRPASRALKSGVDVRPMQSSDLAMIVEKDRTIFGGNRAAVLEWAFHDAPQFAHVVHASDGPTHYCFGRLGRLFDQVGPVVAGDERIAQALAGAALDAAADRPVVVDAFDPSTSSGSSRATSRGDRQIEFAAWLDSRGFAVERPLVRMCRPATAKRATTAVTSSVIVEFAIFGPEFA
jgi:GNAT superfamily N-acetyltransferase